MKIQPSRSLYILQLAIVFSELLGIAVTLYYFVNYNSIHVGDIMKKIGKIFSLIIIPTQCLLGLVYIAFGNSYHY